MLLRVLIVLYAFFGVQGKAFPSRYKRNYEASYHYIPYEEGVAHYPGVYSPEDLQNYQDYVNGYAQTNGHDWSSYYHQPAAPQPVQDPYSDINGYHKMKAQHNWHFNDQNNNPIAHYTDGRHFQSGVEAPSVIEALVKKEVTNGHGNHYETPTVVQALARKDHMNHGDAEVPEVVDSLTIKEKPIIYNGNVVSKDSSIKHHNAFEYKNELSNLDLLTNQQKPSASNHAYESVRIGPVAADSAFELPVEVDSLTKKNNPVVSYNLYEPIKEKPIKEKPIKEKPIKEKPIKEVYESVKDNPVKGKDFSSEEFELPLVMDSLTKKEKPAVSYDVYQPAKGKDFSSDEFELPVVVDSLKRKEKPEVSYGVYGPVKDNPVKGKGFSSDEFELPAEADSLTKKGKPGIAYGVYEPVKGKAFHADELELPVVDLLTKKHVPGNIETVVSYDMYKPIKEKPIKPIKEKPIKPVKYNPVKGKDFSSDEFELPLVMDSLTKKEKPAVSYDVYEPVKGKDFSSDEFELPAEADSLTKKGKPGIAYGVYEPVKGKAFHADELELPAVELLTKKHVPSNIEPVVSYDMYKPVKEKPVKEKPVKEKPVKEKPVKEKPIKPVKEKPIKPIKEKPIKPVKYNPVKGKDFSSDEFELPLVMDSLTKKEKPAVSHDVYEPVKGKDFSSDEFELPGEADSLTKKEKPGISYGVYEPGKGKAFHADELELPAVDLLTKKHVPGNIEPVVSYDMYKPIKEKPIKPIKEKPIKPVKYNPVKGKDFSSDEFELPLVMDSLTKKEKPAVSYDVYEPVKGKDFSSDEFELPAEADSLTKKGKPGIAYGVYEPVKGKAFHADELELPAVELLTKKHVPSNIEPVVSYDMYKPIKEKPIKEKPIKPIKEKPIKPIKEKPIKPIKEKPIKPIKEKPIKPIKEKPIKPIKEKPIKPIKEKPIKPIKEKPIKPIKEKPIKPIKEKPIKPIKEKPIKPIKEKPIKPIKEKPIKPIKEKPIKPIKEKPIKPIKEKPIKPIKEKPIKPIKEKPIKPLKYNPVKGKDFSSDEFELPLVMDSLTKKEKPAVSYDVYEPVKGKDFSSDEFELPLVMDSFTKKEKPAVSHDVYEPAKGKDFSSEEFELPGEADSLTKKEKPGISYGVYEPGKGKAFHADELELPAVELLTKKHVPSNIEPVVSYDMYKPIKEKPIKPIKEKPIKPIKEKPIKPIKEKPIKPIKEKPIKPIKEKPIKPIKEKPIKKPVIPYDASNHPVGLDSSNEVEEHELETPIVIEALIRKEKPPFETEEEHEIPLVVEALVQKHPVHENEETNTKENKMPTKNSIQPVKQSILTKEDVENFDVPIIEALSLEQDFESNEAPKLKDVTSDKRHDFEDTDVDNFNENESAKNFESSRLARSFPAHSNIFSMATHIQEQERRKFKSCVTPKNETGNCMPFQTCSVSSSVSNIDELLRNVCVIDDVFIGVCCPEFPVEAVQVDWEQLNPDREMLNEEKVSQIPKECGRLPTMVTDGHPWPWMASLIAKSSDKTFCGGALITEQYVLTAAHCTIRIPRNQILVRLGRTGSENRPEPDFEVIEIKRHAGYNPKTMQNDIALLKLSRRVQLGDFRRLVCLAKDEDGVESLVSESASLLRWKETPGEIKDVELLSVIDNKECQSRMRTPIADSILCTGPRTDETMCNADSGAPLIIAKDDRFEVIGILTWNRNDCDERFPTVFTRVSSYHRWIEKLAS